MNTISPSSSGHSGVLDLLTTRSAAAALAVLTALGLSNRACCQQGGPPAFQKLELTVSNDAESYSTDLTTGSMWIKVRCVSQSEEAGGWFGGIGEAWVDGATGSSMERTTVEFWELAKAYDSAATQTYTGLSVPCLLLDGESFFSEALTISTSTGVQESPEAVRSHLDPLFLPSPGPFIQQDFGITPTPRWPRDEEGINLDLVLQEAVWSRIGEDVLVNRDEYFNSDAWAEMLDSSLVYSVMLIGMRGPHVLPGHGAASGSEPPPLTGFPDRAPKFTASNESKITFSGTIQLGDDSFGFWPTWDNSYRPIMLVNPGSIVSLPAAGFRPKMQIRLKKHGVVPQTRVVDLFWQDYGQVRFRMPHTAQSGSYSISKYRFFLYEVAGVPIYSNWTVIPESHRPQLVVQ